MEHDGDAEEWGTMSRNIGSLEKVETSISDMQQDNYMQYRMIWVLTFQWTSELQTNTLLVFHCGIIDLHKCLLINYMLSYRQACFTQVC